MNRSIGLICLILLGFTVTVILAQTTTRRPTTARAGATTARAGATTARAGATTARAGATTTARAGAATTRAAGAATTTTRPAGAATTRPATAAAGTVTTAGAATPAAAVTTASTTTTTTAAGGSTASAGSTTTGGSTTSGPTGSTVSTSPFTGSTTTSTPFTGSTTTSLSSSTVSTASTPSTTPGGTVPATISCPPLRPANVNLTQIAGQWYIQAYTGPPGGGPLTTTCDTFFISIDPTGQTGSILYTYNTIPNGMPGSEVASLNALPHVGQFYYSVPGEAISMTATILEFQSGVSYVHVACPTNGGQATVVIGTKIAQNSPSVVSSLIQQAASSGAPMSDILTVSRPNGC